MEVLGFGEALHGGEEILILRNRLFQRLVDANGYTAIVIESSFPKAWVMNDYIGADEPASYEQVRDTGWSHGFGRYDRHGELHMVAGRLASQPLPAGALRCHWISSGCVSEANGIGRPELETLEARLTASPGPTRFIPTDKGEGFPAVELAALPTRSAARLTQHIPLSLRRALPISTGGRY